MGKNIVSMLKESYPGLKIQKTLGEGAFSEAYLFKDNSGLKKVLKLTNASAAMQSAEAESSFRMTKERIGGEWLALLDYSPEVVRTEKALCFDHNEKRFMLMDKAVVKDLYHNPEKREGKVYTLVGTISDYMEGSKELADKIGKAPPIKLDEIRFIAKQILQGVQSIHEMGGKGKTLAHRDLKPANILIDDQNRIKIIDFGFARVENWSKLQRRPSFVGSDNFMAPEIVRAEFYDEKVDAYSIGAILYQMATKKVLKDRNQIATSRIDESLKDLVLNLTSQNSRERLSPKEALKHPFFTA
jgi:serine/threonine protein kinase